VSAIAALADVAHADNLPLVIDSTLATPYLCLADRALALRRRLDPLGHEVTCGGTTATTIAVLVAEAAPSDWGQRPLPRFTDPVAS